MTDSSFAASAEFQLWRKRWQERLSRQSQTRDESRALMRRHNPALIPRNHKVEEAVAAGTEGGDLSVMEILLDVLKRPFDYERDLPEFSTSAPSGDPRYLTYCGT
jgi:uncharacterized protein YdiU (UPF0061 family)